jgi:branched-chain amino acid transport system substrate-binding protein
MKNSISVLLLFITAGLFLGSTSTAFCLPEGTQANPSLSFGIMAPLSGAFANYGVHIRDAVQLAQADIKNSTGVEIALHAEDACLPQQALSAARNLIYNKHIVALVGSYCVVGLVPTLSLLQSNRVLSFHTSPLPESVLRGSSVLFTTNVTSTLEANFLAHEVVAKRGLKQLAIISVATPWGEDFAVQFSNAAKNLGATILTHESTSVEQTDYRAEILKLKAKNPEALYIAHVGGQLGLILKQTRELGMHVPIFSVDEAEEESVLEVARQHAEGLVIPVSDVEDSTQYKDFSQRFVARFGYTPGILSANAYDAAVLAAQALHGCDQVDEAARIECATKKIREVKDYKGASGTLTITSAGTLKNFKLKVVKDGEFRALK